MTVAEISAGSFLLAHAWQLALLLVLLGASAFFSASETAMFSLSRSDQHELAQDPRRSARMVGSLMRRPGAVLTAILLGNNFVNILYFLTSTVLLIRLGEQLGPLAGAIGAVASLVLILLAGEVLPKALAFVAARRLVPWAAPVLAVLCRVSAPVRAFLMAGFIDPFTRLLAPRRPRRRKDLTDGELAALLTLSQQRGIIGADENELLQEVLALTELTAGDIMVPRVDMAAYEVGGGSRGLLELLRERRVTKVPVYEGGVDNIVGVLHAKRLLVEPPDAPLRSLLSSVHYVPEAARLEKVLLQFRVLRTTLAIVVDEYGGTAGLITLEDILEEIVGDIAEARQEGRAPTVTKVGASEWLVDGHLPVHEWADAFPIDLGHVRVSTIGGFVVSLLGQMPKVGQTARYRNVVFTVEAVRRRRITLLRVRLEGGA